jgi:DNA-binding MarR family transcriptional regulator
MLKFIETFYADSNIKVSEKEIAAILDNYADSYKEVDRDTGMLEGYQSTYEAIFTEFDDLRDAIGAYHEKITYNTLAHERELSDKQIASLFGYKNTQAFVKSSAYDRIKSAVGKIIHIAKSQEHFSEISEIKESDFLEGDSKDIKSVSKFFQTLQSGINIRVLNLLLNTTDISQKEIVEITGLKQPYVSKSLKDFYLVGAIKKVQNPNKPGYYNFSLSESLKKIASAHFKMLDIQVLKDDVHKLKTHQSFSEINQIQKGDLPEKDARDLL